MLADSISLFQSGCVSYDHKVTKKPFLTLPLERLGSGAEFSPWTKMCNVYFDSINGIS